MARRVILTSLVVVATLVGPLAPAAIAGPIGFGVGYEYPILLNSPRHATFSGTADCDSDEPLVTITLRFRLFQDTVADPPAKALTTVECAPFHVYPWSVEFTGGIFHPGAATFDVRVRACDRDDCMSLRSTSGATIARTTSQRSTVPR
jgi:hypothetical protein